MQVVMLTILTNHLKGFDWINHELLVAKLNAYGVNKASLDFLSSYLTERKLRKVNVSYGKLKKLFLVFAKDPFWVLNIYIWEMTTV